MNRLKTLLLHHRGIAILAVLVAIILISWRETAISANHSENSKLSLKAFPAQHARWIQVKIKSGDSLTKIFSRYRISTIDLKAILKATKNASALKNLTVGKTISLSVNDENRQLLALSYPINLITTLEIKRVGHQFKATLIKKPITTGLGHASATLQHALFTRAVEAKINKNLLVQFSNIFSDKINFSKQVHPGDQIKILYQEYFVDGKKIGDGNIVAAEYRTRNKIYHAIRFHDQYYSALGQNLKIGILRAPLHYTHISSDFTLHRYHPILHISRPHYGTDYAAPMNTPVYAGAEGTVVYAGWERGYGRTLIIKTSPSYTTLYAHLNHFAKGIKRGKYVKQNQLVAYVGETGEATGPHLHYEIHVNGIPRNPRTVKLPNAAPIAKKYRAAFYATAKNYLSQMNQTTHMTHAKKLRPR